MNPNQLEDFDQYFDQQTFFCEAGELGLDPFDPKLNPFVLDKDDFAQPIPDLFPSEPDPTVPVSSSQNQPRPEVKDEFPVPLNQRQVTIGDLVFPLKDGVTGKRVGGYVIFDYYGFEMKFSHDQFVSRFLALCTIVLGLSVGKCVCLSIDDYRILCMFRRIVVDKRHYTGTACSNVQMYITFDEDDIKNFHKMVAIYRVNNQTDDGIVPDWEIRPY